MEFPDIRLLEARDVDACASIVAANWGKESARLAHFQINQSLTTQPWHPSFYVLYDEGFLCGFAGWSWSMLENGIIDISWVHVDPVTQGRGYGSLLINHILTKTKSIAHTAMLSTADPKYYEKNFGFKTIHVTPDDKHIMARTIDGNKNVSR